MNQYLLREQGNCLNKVATKVSIKCKLIVCQVLRQQRRKHGKSRVTYLEISKYNSVY